MSTEPFQGVKYYRRVHFTPYPMVAHIVVVDLQAQGIGFLVTPGDRSETLPLKAQTTSQFARSTGVQIAINGDGFTPWHANGPFDYFPHVGDRVAPDGYAMSQGIAYGPASGPTIYFGKDGEVSFTLGDIAPYNAISGNNMIVVNGKAVEGLDNTYAAPRTAIGLDGSGKRMILFVADGRQPFYSQGATLYEMAQLMIYYGAENAMNMDGGGSSTLVMRNSLGIVQVINSPIQTGIPGRERPVGNQLGIFAQR
ncbi:MAG: phosphodiester glycosidase family protein [Anaerolineales bacterium]